MTMNLTLITSIVLTAALATAGTYYVTTRVQPTAENSVETAAVQQPQTATQLPVTVAVNKETNKPVEVIVRTEIVHKERKHKQIDHVAQSRAAILAKQPHLEVLH
jgi:uncharacterized protein YdgA (DUF945 family)